MMDPMHDFIVDSKSHCFFCLDKIQQPPEHDLLTKQQSASKSSTVNSLQHLSRFLRLDLKNAFTDNEKESILPDVEMSGLKADLCPECASLNEIFSSICQRLEKIKMEAIVSLEHIYRKLIKVQERADSADGFQKQVHSRGEDDHAWIAKLDILKVLRRDAINKCSTKIRDNGPRIEVQNMRERQITKAKQKLPNSSIHEPIIHPAGIKTELDEDKPDRRSDDDQDANSSDECETDDEKESVVVKNEQAEPLDKKEGKKGRGNTQPSGSDSEIDKNLEVITSHSNRNKYRCKLCKKVFSQRHNTVRHIKLIHLKEKAKPSFTCTQCSKVFSLKHTLKVHMRGHSGVKPFECHVCQKQFRQVHQLRNHLLVHGGTGLFPCDLCDKSFSYPNNLNRHQQLVHKGNASKGAGH